MLIFVKSNAFFEKEEIHLLFWACLMRRSYIIKVQTLCMRKFPFHTCISCPQQATAMGLQSTIQATMASTGRVHTVISTPRTDGP